MKWRGPLIGGKASFQVFFWRELQRR
jgi:hypothetical protein